MLGSPVEKLLLTKPSMFVSETFHFYGICRKKRADERTRTADLLITSEK